MTENIDPRGPKEDILLFILVLAVFSVIYLCFK